MSSSASSLRTADVFPVAASPPPKNKKDILGGREAFDDRIRLQFGGYPASRYIDYRGEKRKHKTTHKKDTILHIYNTKAIHKELSFTTKKEAV